MKPLPISAGRCLMAVMKPPKSQACRKPAPTITPAATSSDFLLKPGDQIQQCLKAEKNHSKSEKLEQDWGPERSQSSLPHYHITPFVKARLGPFPLTQQRLWQDYRLRAGYQQSLPFSVEINKRHSFFRQIRSRTVTTAHRNSWRSGRGCPWRGAPCLLHRGSATSGVRQTAVCPAAPLSRLLIAKCEVTETQNGD